MQKITPFLWFDDQAEEAMNFYVSIFKNSKVISTTYPLPAHRVIFRCRKLSLQGIF